ncbi:MAG: hypothetical protein AAFR27_15675 [Pseudomonadota bacterium]
MLDFTNTPERRRKAKKARERKAMIFLGLAILIPAAASAIDLQSLGVLTGG